jgi:hypothetical protein
MIESVKSIFKTHPVIVAAYIFGSRVYGKGRKTSDYDFAILNKGQYTLDEQLDLTLKLAQTLDVKLDSIDLIELNRAPVELAFEIISKGKLIYCRNDDLRVEFETRLLREYLDLKPYLDLYYNHMYKRLSRKHPNRTTKENADNLSRSSFPVLHSKQL